MLNGVTIDNFGPIAHLDWMGFNPINLLMGPNGSGKTFLLKILYIAMRTIEEYKRSDDRRAEAEILADKLYWTFQVGKIGGLVKDGAPSLSCSIQFRGKDFSYHIGKGANRRIGSLQNEILPRTENSVFISSVDIFSLQQIILKSRERDKVFGFDDTCLDLARALHWPIKKSEDDDEFADVRKRLQEIIGGHIEFEEGSGRWLLKKKDRRIPLGAVADGVKKIAVLDVLLGNGHINGDSVVFFDGLESLLHPSVVSELLDIIAELTSHGVQFFIASHSQCVIKKLFRIAQERKFFIPVLSAQFENGEWAWTADDLADGMPSNARQLSVTS